jgi:glutamate synthase (NADPH/NADH) large chain
LKGLLEQHLQYTESTVAKNILANWSDYQSQFIKVMPTDYKRVLEAIRVAEVNGTSVDDAVMEASNG